MAIKISDSFIGTGFKFPFEISAQGISKAGINRATGVELILMSVRQIIGTLIGSRVMRRDFGSRIHDIPFEPADETTNALVRHFIIEALTRWEKRIRITGINIQFDRSTSQLQIAVNFRIRASNQDASLTVPFSQGV